MTERSLTRDGATIHTRTRKRRHPWITWSWRARTSYASEYITPSLYNRRRVNLGLKFTKQGEDREKTKTARERERERGGCRDRDKGVLRSGRKLTRQGEERKIKKGQRRRGQDSGRTAFGALTRQGAEVGGSKREETLRICSQLAPTVPLEQLPLDTIRNAR